ncbi:uncharacterized protein LOC115006413 [Cottoperca gobio]|uniref:Uncharacterized protein LOC115006413 n=1 Tax=Cottoperca gobio TaxID=56716 RepID=A0A6J2PGR2_COTGO|nr:uncharacterized protein LOC115006413 [Cottoperca gobio]XP_029284502.1 uncharacterized protein LOC115006413 [Cottoperca gobio]
MSTSDSDYSIDWLASDEDDYDSPTRLSPHHAEESPVPPSSTSSLREPPTSCLHSGATQQRMRWSDYCDCKNGGGCGVDSDSPAAPQTPTLSPVQGLTSVCEQLSAGGSKHHSTRKRAHSAHVQTLCEKTQPDTENELFSQKCAELQCYIQPLSSILRGLRSGRYSERLSSFQESVAMDRIQRITGVLQNPNMGGRFLTIILKIEEMLQSWFPHVRPNLTQTDDCTPAKKQKQHHHSSASPPPSSPMLLCSSDSSTRLKWLHMSPICSLKTLESTLCQPATAFPLPARCSQEVTQDNAVSSSTDLPSGPLHPRLSRGPLPFKITLPCLVRLLQAKESIIAPRTVGD